MLVTLRTRMGMKRVHRGENGKLGMMNYWCHKHDLHDDVIKWKHFPRYCPFVRGIHRSQRPVTQSFDVFFDLRLNKRLSKQSWVWWFETSAHPLWRHCNGHIMWHCHGSTLFANLRLSSVWTPRSITFSSTGIAILATSKVTGLVYLSIVIKMRDLLAYC